MLTIQGKPTPRGKDLLTLVVAVACLAGCGKPPRSYPCTRLAGSVTIDGQPVAQGAIQLLPLQPGHGPAVGGTIEAGNYAVEGVPLGKLRVLIRALERDQELPPANDGTPRWTTKNLVPQRFREGLEIEISSADQRQDFEL